MVQPLLTHVVLDATLQSVEVVEAAASRGRHIGRHIRRQASSKRNQGLDGDAGQDVGQRAVWGDAELTQGVGGLGGDELLSVATAYNPPPVGIRRRANGMIAGWCGTGLHPRERGGGLTMGKERRCPKRLFDTTVGICKGAAAGAGGDCCQQAPPLSSPSRSLTLSYADRFRTHRSGCLQCSKS